MNNEYSFVSTEHFERTSKMTKFKNFPIYAWGFTIGPAITKLYAEWKAK